MRAFLAIELSPEAKKEVLRIRSLLEKSGFLKAKFVEEENLHLTLKFFGDILEKEAGMIYDVLKGIEFPSFLCRLGKIGFFGGKILWINLEDDGSTARLHDLIDEKLGDFFGRDTRFHNHVTISRIKGIDKERVQELIDGIKINPVEFSVRDYKLKKSELTSRGPSYADVYSFSLK